MALWSRNWLLAPTNITADKNDQNRCVPGKPQKLVLGAGTNDANHLRRRGRKHLHSSGTGQESDTTGKERHEYCNQSQTRTVMRNQV